MKMLSPSTIYPADGSHRRVRRVGRGHGSGRGTMSGRGTKGQRARSGGKSGTSFRSLKRSLQQIPKRRGFSSSKLRPAVVMLSALERVADAGAVVTPSFLLENGIIRRAVGGVKILATGKLTKKINVSGCLVSAGARAAIEASGGTVTP